MNPGSEVIARERNNAATPVSVEVRMYNVGLGDCILLTFTSRKNRKLEKKRILIDFGSTGRNRNGPSLKQLAPEIVKDCGGKDSELEAVVITHRHQDHMSGFGGDSGEIIVKQLRPRFVLQPWTEEPGADNPDAHPAESDSRRAARHVLSLGTAQSVADSILAEVLMRRANKATRQTDEEVVFYCQKNLPFAQTLENEEASSEEVKKEKRLGKSRTTIMAGLDNFRMLDGINTDFISNVDAIENIQGWNWTTGSRQRTPKFRYLQKGSRSVPRIPGLSIKVLGPIGSDHWHELEKSGGVDELWKRLQGLREDAARSSRSSEDKTPDQSLEMVEFDKSRGNYGVPPIFDEDKYVSSDDSRKDSVRWLIEHLDQLRGEQLLNFVRVLDEHLNNTSVILLFEFGGFRMLFPGDAEVAAWKAIIKDEEFAEELKNVDLYKVGHHGSNNATPKLSLWQHMIDGRTADHPLHCVLSTQPTKFRGSIPNRTLLETMRDSPALHLVSTSYPEDEAESVHDDDWKPNVRKFGNEEVVMSYSRVFSVE